MLTTHGFIRSSHLVPSTLRMISLYFLLLSLKVMAREDHERCTKHCESVGVSNSSWVPTAKPKKLAKRPQPSTIHEDFSPEDSPPRDGTPDSLEEFEYLKIRPLISHSNREVVNYNKEDSRNIVTLCEKACYNSSMERVTDECF
jgi:hypothetical protein